MRISQAIDGPDRTAERDAGSGFTLIEVALALAVIAMLAVLALPHVKSDASAILLKAKTAEVAGLLRAERNTALRFARTTRIRIDARKRLIRSEASGVAISIPIGLYLRVSPDAADGIAFDDQGRSSGGRIVLASNHVAYAIDVNRITAIVQISEPQR